MLPDLADTSDGADDFETIRAIQRRFAAYECVSKDVNESLHRPMQVIDSVNETEASCYLFVDRTNAREVFLNNVGKCDRNGQMPQTFDDAGETQNGCSQLPKSALAFLDAIGNNISFQALILSKMMQMESKIEELDKLMGRFKKLSNTRSVSLKQVAVVQLINVPKQRANAKINENDDVHAMHKGPPENPHVCYYKEALTMFPVSMSRLKWTKEENENLFKGVKQQFQIMLLDGSCPDSNEFDSILLSIKNFDITPEKIRLFLPKVDWERLAAMYIPGRSGAECQSRFLNCEDPLINHKQWSPKEDKNLLLIVQKKGLQNWIDIAASLGGTNRTPFQCLARYQRSLNASILKREWTIEEDEKLRDAVETYGESNWEVVASVLEGRTGTQCSNRWLKTLHPGRKRVGKWSVEENKQLEVAVMLFGPKTWKKVAKCVPGRTEVQCRERWVNCLDPCLNMGIWTEEEDLKLEDAIAEYGYRWTKVAACVPGRTDNQCLRRWKVLFPDEVVLRKVARKTQKAALISNFVGRKSERPVLGPHDFVPCCDNQGVRMMCIDGKAGNSKIKKRSRVDDACEDSDPIEDITQKKTCKLLLRQKKPEPSAEVPETAYEAEMRVWNETMLKMKEAS